MQEQRGENTRSFLISNLLGGNWEGRRIENKQQTGVIGFWLFVSRNEYLAYVI